MLLFSPCAASGLVASKARRGKVAEDWHFRWSGVQNEGLTLAASMTVFPGIISSAAETTSHRGKEKVTFRAKAIVVPAVIEVNIQGAAWTYCAWWGNAMITIAGGAQQVIARLLALPSLSRLRQRPGNEKVLFVIPRSLQSSRLLLGVPAEDQVCWGFSNAFEGHERIQTA